MISVSSPAAPLAFAHLNLRRNPFGGLCQADVGAVALMPEFALHTGDAVQLIAPAGRGKTTCLLALLARHRDSIYAHVALEDQTISRGPHKGKMYFLDDAQLARPDPLRSVVRQAETIVLASHYDLSAVAGRDLRSVTLPALDAQRLMTIVSSRIEFVRRGQGRVPVLSPARITALVERYGDDVRAIEDELYDLFQALEGPGDARL